MTKDDEKHVYGEVPRSRRPLAALVLGIVGVLIIAGGLLTNWLTQSPLNWPALLAILGLALLLLSIYLWIRLSD